MIGILDYGMGNLGSVSNACAYLEFDARILSRPEDMASCSAVVLPGVGAFGDCMRHLDEHGFSDPVRDWIAADRPFLGICLGLQVLFEGSEESPEIAGLGVLPGRVERFRIDPSLKVPQIGWNRVRQAQADCPLYPGIPDESHFYFVHSYYVHAADETVVAGETEYGLRYTSGVCRGRMMAVQFHPEKSQKMGLQMLRNFRALAG